MEGRGTVRTKNPFTSQVVDGYGVPESMTATPWWSDGPRPGSGRMAVVLGHEQVGGYGVFNRLTQRRPGDDAVLRDRPDGALHLRVLQPPVTGLDKSTDRRLTPRRLGRVRFFADDPRAAVRPLAALVSARR